MFRKVLVANRGEIAVRIINTCREMGIETVALYQESDQTSLHVRLADECVLLDSPAGFMDHDAILRIARAKGADALHPGYGFLAENVEFIRACEAAGIAFIGAPSAVIARVGDKLAVLDQVRSAGIPAVTTSALGDCADDEAVVRLEAERIGYPVMVKSCLGGRGPGAYLARAPQELEAAFRHALAEAQLVYGVSSVYLEKAVLPAHQIGVQIIADRQGNYVHLEEREGSLLHNGQKVIEESPAPCLSLAQRQQLWQTALQIARLFELQNVGTIEFLVDAAGQFFFTEIKPRLQVEHPLTEMRTRVDLVREQLRIAAGEPLGFTQDDLQAQGWAMLCRVNAEDPLNRYLPSPGAVRVRLPLGADVRVDTYIADQGYVPPEYNPLVAKVTVWGADRDRCLRRMRRALEDFWLPGGRTNLPLLRHALEAAAVVAGDTITEYQPPVAQQHAPAYYRDLAVAAAALYVGRHQSVETAIPARLVNGWHRDSRRLPE